MRDHTADDETIDMTPVGCQTPEGCRRVNQATREFQGATADVANLLTALVEQMDNACGLSRALRELELYEPEDIDFEAKEIRRLLKKRADAQDEFLRAVAGAPPAETR